jgi:predicted outer membrane protein
MKQSVQKTIVSACPTANHAVSRRLALRCSGVAVLGLVSHSAFAQTRDKTTEAPRAPAKPSGGMQERMEQSRIFAERLRNAESMEERQQIMREQMLWQRQQALEGLRDQLGVSDQEWAVLKPRIQVVHDLVHPAPPPMGKSDAPRTEAELRSRELRELLQDQKAPPDQIKARLTALRAAKEHAAQQLINARQGLRQLLTLRQEALLVLNGLLD